MQSALIYRIDPDATVRLRAEMEARGWTIDICGRMLEMLRLIEERDYEVVVINADHMNVETCTMVGMIRELSREPRIILNLTAALDVPPPADLVRNNSVIVGDLTCEKLLEAAKANN